MGNAKRKSVRHNVLTAEGAAARAKAILEKGKESPDLDRFGRLKKPQMAWGGPSLPPSEP